MYVDGVSSKGRPKRYKSRNLHTNLAEAQNDNAFRCVCRQPNSMVLLVPIHYTETYNPKDECANKCRHKGCGNHRAAMLLVLPSLTCCELNIALFAMYMWLWLEYTSDSRHDGFWGVLWRGRRARRGVCVVMGMRVELDIVVLCYCRITRRRPGRRALIHRMVGEDVIVSGSRFLWCRRISHVGSSEDC